MKNVLGLDLGTNSIGWAKVSMDDDGKYLGFREGQESIADSITKGFSGEAAPERTMFTTSGTLAPGVACAEFFT